MAWILSLLTYQGAMLTLIQFEINQLSAALRIPMAIAYASVPVGCGMMSLRLIGKIITLCHSANSHPYIRGIHKWI